MGKLQHQWQNSIGKLFWGFIGAGFGSAILLLGHTVMSERHRVEQLPLLNPTTLAPEVGKTGILEGQISDRTPTRYGTLVAYEQEAWRGNPQGRNPDWKTVHRETPPLWLDTSRGTVQIELAPTSSDYYFKTAYIVYESEDTQTRYRGFKVQDEIVVVGTVRLAGTQTILDAELISAGDRQQLQEDLGSDGKTLYGVGGAIVLVSLIYLIKVLKN